MKIDLFKVFMSPDAPALVGEVLMSGFIGQGDKVEQFEDSLRQRFNNPHINTVNSATSGLQLALHMIKDSPGEEVLTTPLTCFSYHAKVVLSDGSTMSIGEIVNKKLPVEVSCYNHDTNKWENQRVTNWIKHSSDGVSWYRLTTQYAPRSKNSYTGKRGVWITGDHQVYTTRGYIKVEDLEETDKVLTNHPRPNKLQQEVIAGTMLGDAGVAVNKKSACRFNMVHSVAQSDWFKIKLRALNGMKFRVDERPAYKQSGPRIGCEAGGNNYWREVRDLWYSERGNKIIPDDLALTPRVLATWYLDDGSLAGNAAIFCTECFHHDSFWRLFWKVSEVGYRPRAQRHGEGFRLVITDSEDGSSARRFFETIAPFVPHEMRYKLPDDSPEYNESHWELGEAEQTYEKVVVQKGTPPKWEYPSHVYCLEVEKNHNFVASNTLVSNCTATNTAILANGMPLRWVDVDPKTCNVDMDDLSRKVSAKTKAIMLVHWGGLPCDLSRVCEIQWDCQRLYGFSPVVIEDCAHAWGSRYMGMYLGNHSNFAVYSLQAIKHLTTGDGGVLISPSAAYHSRAKLLRWYGLDRTSSFDFRCEQNIPEAGFKYHMNDINAAIGIANLKHIDQLVRAHKENGKFYDEALKGVPGVELIEQHKDGESSYWVYTLKVERRDAFVAMLKDKGVATGRVHDRNDKHRCFAMYRSILPGLDETCAKMICLPCGWWVSKTDREFIVDCIKKGW